MTDATISTLEQVPAYYPFPKGIEVGKRFDGLTVTGRVANDKNQRIVLRLNCDCGVQCTARLTDLRRGHTKSCGCRRALVVRQRFPKLRFRRLGGMVPLGTSEGTGKFNAKTQWVAVCHYCKKIHFATTWQLRRKRKRCPCQERTYSSWRNMKQRCLNPEHSQYADYGGRGIKIHEDWTNSFGSFLDSMGPRPKGKTLDRINPDGDYVPGNCRWADAETQARNRRNKLVRL